MKVATIPAAQLEILLTLAEDQWEMIKQTDAYTRSTEIKAALADGHRALRLS